MEDQFNQFEQSRDVKDLQPLYNAGIYLYRLTDGGSRTKKTSKLNTAGKRLVKMYDKINGKITFTKILVH